MRGGFPNQQELQVLKALGSSGSLDLEDLAEKMGYSATLYKTITELKRIGWVRQSSRGAFGPTGRVRNCYQRTILGDRLFAAFEKLGAELTRRLLAKSGRGFWPVGPELQMMHVLQRRSCRELDVGRLLAQVPKPQRRLKDALRRAHKNGHIDLIHPKGQGPENGVWRKFRSQHCSLTDQGSLVLDLHGQAAIAMTRAKGKRSSRVPIAFPTALQAALIHAIQMFPDGAFFTQVCSALPSETRMVTVPSALMRVCRRRWVCLERRADEKQGRYWLTQEGRRVWRAMNGSLTGTR